MLNPFPGILPKLARSWSLMLEEVLQILWRGLISTSHRWFKVVHQPKAYSWASVSLATTLNMEWKIVAQARLNCYVSGYNFESGMIGCGLGSLELICLWLQIWIWNDTLWLRFAWCRFEACRWPSFPPLSNTRWDDGENSIARMFNTLEQVLTYDWNILLVLDAPVAKKWSIQGEYFFLQEVYFWSICVKNEFSDHNAFMGEDKNNDLSHGKLDHNVGIYKSSFVEEE